MSQSVPVERWRQGREITAERFNNHGEVGFQINTTLLATGIWLRLDFALEHPAIATLAKSFTAGS